MLDPQKPSAESAGNNNKSAGNLEMGYYGPKCYRKQADLGNPSAQYNIGICYDAGLGVPSEASLVMECGADAVLVNTAIAGAKDPKMMAEAFKLGVQAGRNAYLSGRIPKSEHANASSPKDNIVNS